MSIDNLPAYLQRAALRHRLQQASKQKAAVNIWQPFEGKPQEAAYHSPADIMFYGGAAGGGKALDCETPILTPQGWRTMGILAAGDRVFGANGQPTRVLAVSEIMTERRVFEVVFDDGSVIAADADHLWHTFTDAERSQRLRHSPAFRARRRDSRPSRGTGKRPDLAARNSAQATLYSSEAVTGGVRTTLEIAATLSVRGGRTNHAVEVAAPLDCPAADLPIDPYILGLWLGDGHSASGRVTIGTQYIHDAQAAIEACGYELLSWNAKTLSGTIKGIKPRLRQLGVLGNKHIPAAYLSASIEQRQELLRGLMDTDGYAAKNGLCEFYSSSARLIADVSDLLHGLGIKHAIKTKLPPKGTAYAPSYRIKFSAGFPVFRLPQKAERQSYQRRETQHWRYIVDVREVASMPVRCIQVEADDGLFLAGRALIPTHNSSLLVGLAMTRHLDSIIFRRQYTHLKGLIKEGNRILKPLGIRYVAGDKRGWHDIPADGGRTRTVTLGAVNLEEDVEKFQGNPHDLVCFDELPHFAESQFRFLMGWNRTDVMGQRTRVAAAGNPPLSIEQEWVIDFFAPWLDEDYTGTPAEPGELRWFVTLDGKDHEVEDEHPVMINGESVKPLSRTFIPAFVEDNPIYMATNYKAILQAMQPELQDAMLRGKFQRFTGSHPWQVIPTAWVLAAQERWKQGHRPEAALRAMGVDVARGGSDETVLALLRGTWFDLITEPGKDTPNGDEIARMVLQHRENCDLIGIDAIGVGTSPYDVLKKVISIYPINAGDGSLMMDSSGKFGFNNLRTEMWWMMREALDPNSGENIALPPDRQLRVDLCAPQYKLVGANYAVEKKEEIKKRIGRSPDRGDSIVMCWHLAKFGAGGVRFF